MNLFYHVIDWHIRAAYAKKNGYDLSKEEKRSGHASWVVLAFAEVKEEYRDPNKVLREFSTTGIGIY